MASIRFNIGSGFVFEFRLATAVVRGDVVHHATTQVASADGNGNVSITVLDDALYFGRAVKSGATTELMPFYTKPGANFEAMVALAKEMMEGDEGLTAAREAWLAVVDQVSTTAAQAKASATNAANSASSASNSANSAAASATAANNSKNAAATSATNAANSASTASSTVTQGVSLLTTTRDEAANSINVAKTAAEVAVATAQRNAITAFNNQVASSSVSTIGTTSQAGKLLKADSAGLVYSTHTPTSNNELANKLYVDNSVSGVRGGVAAAGDTLQKVYSRLLTALDEIEGIKSDIISISTSNFSGGYVQRCGMNCYLQIWTRPDTDIITIPVKPRQNHVVTAFYTVDNQKTPVRLWFRVTGELVGFNQIPKDITLIDLYDTFLFYGFTS